MHGPHVRSGCIALVSCLAIIAAAPAAFADDSATPAPSPAAATASANPLGRVALEARLAKGLGKADDLRGVMDSLYKGSKFKKKHERIRRCIVRRESHANYRAVARNGRFGGAYQMSRPLARGATHMMLAEVRRDFGAVGVAMLTKLRKTPVHKWNRYWQDRAFWTIWRKGKGARHWGGKHCH